MAELVDAHDSNSCAERRVGSIPTSGTKKSLGFTKAFFVLLLSYRTSVKLKRYKINFKSQYCSIFKLLK